MSIATWGLLFAIMPKYRPPIIELMDYAPATSLSDCMTKANHKWQQYYQSGTNKTDIYTYCQENKKSKSRIIDIVCDQGGNCGIVPHVIPGEDIP
jgi:hypothetical protein